MNTETDKREKEKKFSHRKVSNQSEFTLMCSMQPLSICCVIDYNPQASSESDVVIQGYGFKMSSGLFSKWEKKYFMLYPNRIEFGDNIQVGWSPFTYLL